VARVLRTQLGTSLPEYTFVDFCAGAGGPTPAIECALNRRTNRTHRGNSSNISDGQKGGDEKGVDFILTDVHPHLPAWHAAALQSQHILFVPEPVDASKVPLDLVSRAVRRRHDSSKSSHDATKQFRLFSLALHHFDDAQAAQILRYALRTSSGFGVFELQARNFESLGLMAVFWPLMWVGSWWWFWGQWDLLFWMYIIPVVPFVVVYDGVISSLRTRTPAEVLRLIKGGGGAVGSDKNDRVGIEWEKWRFASGTETHTWPLGEMNWFVGVKKED
jgi:hypothetical protein